MNFIRKITHGSSNPPKTKATKEQQVSYAPEDDESRESTPASPPYPKAGNGLMSKLGPDAEDMEWLVDDNDFEAFSHTVFPSIP
jgi:hypothetical protein